VREVLCFRYEQFDEMTARESERASLLPHVRQVEFDGPSKDRVGMSFKLQDIDSVIDGIEAWKMQSPTCESQYKIIGGCVGGIR